MYFNNTNNFFHGIMFHHFHNDDLYTKSQGSVSKDDFYRLIKFIGKKNILNANEFFEKFKENKLKDNEVCLTFDDGIKSQIGVALPILEDLKIKSFFFPPTSIFEGKPGNLEVFRYFRENYFKDIDDFYINFYKILNKDLKDFFKLREKNIKNISFKFPVYSIEDIKFRLIRDLFLKKDEYENILFIMMKDKKFEPKKFYYKIIFNNEDLKELNSLGHIIGLHSHNHPTLLEKLNYNEQKYEYERSVSIITKILNKSKNTIKCMSHPNGSYNNDTLHILKEIGIELGFKQIMKIETEKGMKKINNSYLEIARQDHANIIKQMN